MSADQIKTFFDVNSVAIMFAVGLVWKYVPALDKLANFLIPWLNVALYMLAKILGPQEAHAADGAVIANGVGVVIGGLTNSFWASLFFDKFAKPLIEKFFGRHKSDVRHDLKKMQAINN